MTNKQIEIKYNNKYDAVVAKQILDYYSTGMTFNEISKIKGMPTRWTVYRWRLAYPDFDRLFTKAIECQSDAMIEAVLTKIKTCEDTKRGKLLDVEFKATSWYVSKTNKAKFGDSLQVTQNVKIDISPLLKRAMDRLKTVDTSTLIDVDAKEITG